MYVKKQNRLVYVEHSQYIRLHNGEDFHIGKWFHDQLALMKEDKLPVDRLAKMNELAAEGLLMWGKDTPSNGLEVTWDVMFNSVEKFINENQNANIPSDLFVISPVNGTSQSLKVWVFNQLQFININQNDKHVQKLQLHLAMLKQGQLAGKEIRKR